MLIELILNTPKNKKMKNNFLIILALFLGTLNLYSQNLNKSKTYAVVVGISDYQDEAIPDLNFAHKDAQAFAEFLRSPAGGNLDEEHLKVLINSEATMAQFAIALDWLMEVAKENDQVVIYFAGHGDVEKKTITQPGFLLCWDAPAKVYMAGGTFALPFLQEVVSTLSLQNKSKVVVVTDACRSGKLAGSSVGGSSITSSNLAKQYANEIKILSCQPDEYSLEGTQWGGGRGVFSYHLTDALYGMADKNEDLSVTLMEVSRYLEDNVIAEVAPNSQIPIVVGKRTERLAFVSEDILTKLKKNREENTRFFASTESRGLEEDVLSTVDSATNEIYELFKKAIAEKVFLEPVDACAETYYTQLIADPKLKKLHSNMRRTYAAALQDDAQQVLNRLLDFDPNICYATKETFLKNYGNTPAQIKRATELLGENHYMFRTLKARQYWFEGYLKDLGVEEFEGEDLLKASREKLRLALEYLPNMPQAYLSLGKTFIFSNEPDSADFYFRKAMESAPAWIYPYTASYYNQRKNGDIEIGKKRLDEAWAIDSNQIVLMVSRASYFELTNQPLKAKEMLEASIAMDSTIFCTWNNLSLLYMNYFGDFDKAEEAIKRASELDASNVKAIFNLAIIKVNTGKPDTAIHYLKKVLEMEPSLTMAYTVWGSALATKGQIEEAEAMYFKGIKEGPELFQPYINLAFLYIETDRFVEADSFILKSIDLAVNKAGISFSAGQDFLKYEQFSYAEKYFNLCIEYGGMRGNARLFLAVIKAQQNKPAEALQFLEQAIENGMKDPNGILQNPAFESLKDRDDFKALVEKHFPE